MGLITSGKTVLVEPTSGIHRCSQRQYLNLVFLYAAKVKGKHLIQGIGSGSTLKFWTLVCLMETVQVISEDAIETVKKLALKEDCLLPLIGAARTQAPTATNYDVGSPTHEETLGGRTSSVQWRPPIKSMSLQDRPSTPSRVKILKLCRTECDRG
ncbi:hypothetical protein ACOSQ3_015027 [Xanthoceras sorbifolium]